MERKSIDPAAQIMIERASEAGISTLFSRADEIKPCTIGAEGMCCRICAMGPCRLTGKDKEEKTGVCGATASTIAARSFARMVAAGASAHSDHGRDAALALLATARGEAHNYRVKDEGKLRTVAGYLGIDPKGKDTNKLAEQVALAALENFGQQSGTLAYVSRAPQKRQDIWAKEGITPRGIDREIVEVLHRTHAGTDQEARSLLDSALRCALSSGWGGSMLATDLQDILFGTPSAVRSKANLGVLQNDAVNVVIHGHEPTLSEMIVTAAGDPELVAYAKSKGAAGINLAGICCTSNETLMRHGVPPAGNMAMQELAILTGAVDAMVVDVQCVFQGLAKTAKDSNTLLITTSSKAHIQGATHIQFDKARPLDTAKDIIRAAIDNFENRREVFIPDIVSPLVAGFSHEYIRYILGGLFSRVHPLHFGRAIPGILQAPERQYYEWTH
jgi:anaerobic carbon-monoxide dehydrogenase catalytic subunit